MSSVIDMFCGGGGLGLGFQQAGYEIPLAFDFDKYAVETYRANVGDHVKQLDITKLTAGELPYADVWTFGFPCQDLSVAGKQAGLFEGKRSGLFFEVMRLLDESAEKPKVLLAENVKGLKSYLPVLESEFKARGYRMYVHMFNSKYWDVPQNRERYYVVGVREDTAGEFVYPVEQHEFIPKLTRDLEKVVDEKYYYSEEKTRNIIEIALKKTGGEDPQNVFTDKDGVAYACNARYFKGCSYTDVVKSRNTQVVEPRIIDDTYGYEEGARVYQDVSPTLRSSRQGLKVLEEPKITVVGLLYQQGHEARARVHDPEGLSPTVDTCCGGGHQVKILDGYRVRRLTPTEYGRLQGFPMDTWKQVVSNTQAYKQFGNAVTVTLGRAMAKAIKEFLGG